jgi:hypothetical protein
VRRVGQRQREVAVAQDVPDRLPIDAGRLHHDMRAAFRRQPLRQGQQIGGRRLERADLALDRAVRHVALTGHDRVLVNVEAGAVWVENFHVILRARRRRGTSVRRTLENVLRSRRRPLAQSGVLRRPGSN